MSVVYVLWLRELKKYLRSRVQIVASLGGQVEDVVHGREQIQAALCFKQRPDKPDERIDGTWGSYTKQKLEQYQCRTGRTPDGKLSDDVKKELLALSDDQIKQQCGGQ